MSRESMQGLKSSIEYHGRGDDRRSEAILGGRFLEGDRGGHRLGLILHPRSATAAHGERVAACGVRSVRYLVPYTSRTFAAAVW